MIRTTILGGLAAALLVCGAAQADLARGLSLLDRGRFDDAAEVLRPLADSGDTAAQYALAVMLRAGMLDKADPAAALALLEMAAEAGYMPAQIELARIYRNGDGTDQDFERMMHWYARAAEGGDVGAQLFLADGYAFGTGVPRDRIEAYKWYQIAMRYWGDLAATARDVVAEDMTAADIREAERRARSWLGAHPSAD